MTNDSLPESEPGRKVDPVQEPLVEPSGESFADLLSAFEKTHSHKA